ncbi:MAG: Tol-Pal system beta propeller repeat protein TolB, partial [Gammaproteobacteria bacterium]
MLRGSYLSVLLIVILSSLPGSVWAALTIEITQGREGALPIAIVPFGWQGAASQAPEDIAAIVAGDLRRSGSFAPLPERDMFSRPHDGSQVRFQDWRILGVGSLVIGKLQDQGGGNYVARFQLFDVFRAKQIAGYNIPAKREELRRVAHYISDLVYEQLTGQPGAFNTRMAYVTAIRSGTKFKYELQVADSDGHNPQTVLRSTEPVMSPSWSPDGMQLAYVSFEKKKPEIYIQDVATAQRRRVSSQPGINGAPVWSPDGKRLALTLSRDGNPEIYVLDIRSDKLRRLTNHSAIDTEPVWAPDGRSLVFTSDRGGGPQLYRVSASGGAARRLTFEGNYNAAADFSPDGRKLAMVHTSGGRYQIAVLDLETDLLRILTDGSLDESPSFAPNGSMILYATNDGPRGVLSAVSVDGRFRQRLLLRKGDVREP